MADNNNKGSSGVDNKASEDTAKAVQQLMETMQARFQQLSDKIISRIDDMGNRIDDLERSIAVLMKESEENRATPQASITASPSGKLTSGSRMQAPAKKE